MMTAAIMHNQIFYIVLFPRILCYINTALKKKKLYIKHKYLFCQFDIFVHKTKQKTEHCSHSSYSNHMTLIKVTAITFLNIIGISFKATLKCVSKSEATHLERSFSRPPFKKGILHAVLNLHVLF